MKWEGVRDGTWMEFLKKLILEGKRETLMRDDRLPSAYPLLGTEHTTPVCGWTGNQTVDLSVHRMRLNQRSHSSQGRTWMEF